VGNMLVDKIVRNRWCFVDWESETSATYVSES